MSPTQKLARALELIGAIEKLMYLFLLNLAATAKEIPASVFLSYPVADDSFSKAYDYAGRQFHLEFKREGFTIADTIEYQLQSNLQLLSLVMSLPGRETIPLLISAKIGEHAFDWKVEIAHFHSHYIGSASVLDADYLARHFDSFQMAEAELVERLTLGLQYSKALYADLVGFVADNVSGSPLAKAADDDNLLPDLLFEDGVDFEVSPAVAQSAPQRPSLRVIEYSDEGKYLRRKRSFRRKVRIEQKQRRARQLHWRNGGKLLAVAELPSVEDSVELVTW